MASSESVCVSVAISPSSISFLMTSGAEQLERLGDLLDGRARADGDRADPPGAPPRQPPLPAPRDPAPPTGDGACGRALAGPAAAEAAECDRAAPPESRLRHGDAGHPGRHRRRSPARPPRVGRAPPRWPPPDPPPAPGTAAATGPGTAPATAGAVALTRAAALALRPRRLRRRSLLKNARATALGTGALDLALRSGRALNRAARPRRPWLRLGSAWPARPCRPRGLASRRRRLGLRGGLRLGFAPSAFAFASPSPSAFFAFAGAFAGTRAVANAFAASASSTLEEAVVTSSPAFCKAARASFEVIPCSFAISWTRFFAIR